MDFFKLIKNPNWVGGKVVSFISFLKKHNSRFLKFDLLKRGPWMHSADIEALLTQGNFVWWYYFWMTKLYLGFLETVTGIFLCCCCWPDFYVYYEWFLESTILKFCPLSLFGWFPSRGPLWKRYCLFAIVKETSLGFCLLFVVLTISDSNLPPNKNCVSLTNLSLFL